MCGISEEINQELERRLLLCSLLEVFEINKERNQELHRGLLPISLLRNV
jgi:hypothetical protein